MTGHVKVGFELEMSDILTKRAATIVYGDISEWHDRYDTYSKPKLSYDRFHVMSDGSLINSDWTRCMSTFRSPSRLRPAHASEGHPHHLKWKGAELISPVIDWDDPQARDRALRLAESYFKKFRRSGAICSPRLFDGLHVHIDISDLAWHEVGVLPRRIRLVQDLLVPLATYWKGISFFTYEQLLAFCACQTDEEFWEAYKTVDGRTYVEGDDEVRRIIDVGPYFDPARPNTIEFRCFRAALDVAYIASCIEFSIELLRGMVWRSPRDLVAHTKNAVAALLEQYKEVFSDYWTGIRDVAPTDPVWDAFNARLAERSRSS